MASSFEKFLLGLAGGLDNGVQGWMQGKEWREGRERKAREEAEEKERYDMLMARQRKQDAMAAERQTWAGQQHTAGMYDKGFYRDNPATLGPDPADTQSVGPWRRMPEEQVDPLEEELRRLTAISKFGQEQGGAPGQVYSNGSWQWPPGYGRATPDAADAGPSTLDLKRFQEMAYNDAERWARSNGRVAESIDGPGEVRWDPDVNNVYEQALQGYMGTAPEPGTDTSGELEVEMRAMAAGVFAGEQEDIDGLVALRAIRPDVAAGVDKMVEELSAASGGTRASTIGGVFDTVGGIFDTVNSVRNAPSRLRESAGDVAGQAWPLESLLRMLRR